MQLIAADVSVTNNSNKLNNSKQAKWLQAVYRFDQLQAADLLQIDRNKDQNGSDSVDINFHYPPFGNTALLEMVEALALAGRCVQAKTKIISMIQWLMAQGASINAVNTQGNSAMIVAAAYGDCRLLAFLYGLGASVDFINIYGESVFTIAAYQNILPFLLRLVPEHAINQRLRASFAKPICSHYNNNKTNQIT